MTTEERTHGAQVAHLTDPGVMLLVALGLADGHLEQADRLLCRPDHVTALLHMRTAAGWLKPGAEITAQTGRAIELL